MSRKTSVSECNHVWINWNRGMTVATLRSAFDLLGRPLQHLVSMRWIHGGRKERVGLNWIATSGCARAGRHAARQNLMSRARRTRMEHSSSQIGAWFSPACTPLTNWQQSTLSTSSRRSGANDNGLALNTLMDRDIVM